MVTIAIALGLSCCVQRSATATGAAMTPVMTSWLFVAALQATVGYVQYFNDVPGAAGRDPRRRGHRAVAMTTYLVLDTRRPADGRPTARRDSSPDLVKQPRLTIDRRPSGMTVHDGGQPSLRLGERLTRTHSASGPRAARVTAGLLAFGGGPPTRRTRSTRSGSGCRTSSATRAAEPTTSRSPGVDDHRRRRRRQRGRHGRHGRRGHRRSSPCRSEPTTWCASTSRRCPRTRPDRRVDGRARRVTLDDRSSRRPPIVNFFTGESHSGAQSRLREARPAHRRRHPARADPRHVLGRPVADLRHDRPDELRPWRDGHVRGDDGVPVQRDDRVLRPRLPLVDDAGDRRPAVRSRSARWCSVLDDRVFFAPLRRRGIGLVSQMVVTVGLSIMLREHLPVPVRRATPAPHGDYNSQVGMGPRTGHDHAARPDRSPCSRSLVLVAVALALQTDAAGQGDPGGQRQRRPRLGDGHRHRSRSSASCGSSAAALAALGGIFRGLDEQVGSDMGSQPAVLDVRRHHARRARVGATARSSAASSSACSSRLSTLFGVPTELKTVPALVVLILVLLVRPQGILGRRQRVG